MAQYFQIEGTQQVFYVPRNAVFATQESSAVNQTNATVLQHPQGVLLADAIAAPQNNSTFVRYSDSQPPALFYHTSSPVVESQQNEGGIQQTTILQQISQFQPLQGTLVGNHVVHNHITNETYEVTVEETDEQVEDGALLYEGELAEQVSDLESISTQTVITSTDQIRNESGGIQFIQQSNQVAAPSQLVGNQAVQPAKSQPCVLQQHCSVQQNMPSLQQHQQVASDAVPVSAVSSSALTQSYVITTQASGPTVHPAFVQSEKVVAGQQVTIVKPQTQLVKQVQVFQQAKQPPLLVRQQVNQSPSLFQQVNQQVLQQVKQQVSQHTKLQPQVVQQVKQQVIQHTKQQPQVLQQVKQQVLQPAQLLQQLKQQQVIQQVKQPSQVIQLINQQTQVTQPVNQQNQPVQQVNQQTQVVHHISQQSEVIQHVSQQPQSLQSPVLTSQTILQPGEALQAVSQQSLTIQPANQQLQVTPSSKVSAQTANQQHQRIQQVKLQSVPKLRSIDIDKSSASVLQSLQQGPLQVTKSVLPNKGSTAVRQRKTPNITRKSSLASKQSRVITPVQVQSPLVAVPLTPTVDLPPSKCDELIHHIKTDDMPGDILPQEQTTPTVPGTSWTVKGQLVSPYQENSHVEPLSPQADVQESPQSSQTPVVHVRLETSNAPTSTPVKQIVVQNPAKRMQTYSGHRNRYVANPVTREITSASPHQQVLQKAVQSQTLVIQRDSQIQQQSPATATRKDHVLLVVPPTRQFGQNNSNLRATGGNKVVQLSLNEAQLRAYKEGTISIKPDGPQSVVLTAGNNVVVIKTAENAFISTDGKRFSLTDGALTTESKKVMPGKFALCKNCGYSSQEFYRCSRCKKVLPSDCKVVDAKDIANGIWTEKKDTVILEKLRSNKATKFVSLAVNNLEVKKKQPVRRAKIPDVPECLTLSSDEEDGNTNNDADELDAPCDEDHEEMDEHHNAEDQHYSSSVEGGGLLEQASDGSLSGPLIQIICRTVRIGSYKHKPLQRVVIAKPGIEIVVPNPSNLSDPEGIKVFISMQEIRRILVCMDRTMPVFFVLVRSATGTRIRELLKMTDATSDFYFNPDSKEDLHKRITLLPEKLTEENKSTVQLIIPSHLLVEIPYPKANELLLRSCPKETQAQVRKSCPSTAISKIQTIMVYPPPPAKGGISINTEDYSCLGEDVFLNDVIIDFYLKYLMLAVLSPEDRERTHVFSTFFYKRLTSPPGKSMRASHPVESNPNLSPAEKRHARVKSWTKNINLFTKDFIIIPINEKCHWFLAIICFPGQDGCLRMVDNTPVLPPSVLNNTAAASVAAAKAAATAAAVAAASGSSKIKVNSNNVLSIGSTTITPVKASDTITLDCSNGDEGSDRDEAEGDEEEMNEPTSDDDEESAGAAQATENTTPAEETPAKTESPEKTPNVAEIIKNCRAKYTRDAIKQPCILIFDSLSGAPRYRVVATLRDYLKIEHKVKQGKEKDYNKDTIKGMMPKVPQQRNFTDCGLYLLQYVEQFFKDPIKDYHYPIQTLKEWFPAEVVRRKRQEIQLLLHKLMEDQKVDMSKLKLPTLTFSSLQEEGDAGEGAGDGEAAAAASSAEEEAARAAAEAATAAQELVWGAAGAEEEVTTDGVAQHEQGVPGEYAQGDGEEYAEGERNLEEEGLEPGEVAIFGDGEGEEEAMDHDGEEECGVTDRVVLTAPGQPLVSYPDSEDSGSRSPCSSPAPVVTMTTSDSNKRAYVLHVEAASDAKKMRFSNNR